MNKYKQKDGKSYFKNCLSGMQKQNRRKKKILQQQGIPQDNQDYDQQKMHKKVKKG